MRFDDLDKEMRIYETIADYSVLPDMYMVARLDGRGFTKMTKDKEYQKPFDPIFVSMMISTMRYVFSETGFNFSYGYVQSDEISLLFKHDENSFNRKTRKLDSILASAAASYLSLLVGLPVMFDSRISQLPNIERVVDYFRWRQMDAERNCLSSYSYWTLRELGYGATAASNFLLGVGPSAKQEFLFNHGINFNDVNSTLKRGAAIYYRQVDKKGYNPKTKEHVVVKRQEVVVDHDLPFGDDYGVFVEGKIQ